MDWKNKIVWKDIEGYEKLYKVNNIGQIKSNYKTKKILNPQIDKDGYKRVFLFKSGKGKWYFVHRLVLNAFIKNKYKKEQVNHINGIKDDNRLENLEWCTQSENQLHRCHILNKTPLNPSKGKFGKDNKLSKKVYQYDENHKLIKVWDCLTDISRELKINISRISNCCNNKQKKSNGYIWRFNNE